MTSANPTIGTKVGRARRSLGQLWQVPTFLLGLLALAGAGLSAPWRHTPEWWEFEEQTISIRRGLDQGMDPEALIGPAENALRRVDKFPSRAGEIHFLAGSVYYRQAQLKQAGVAKLFWTRAIEHLEQASTLNIPAEDAAALQYRLGFCLYRENKDVARAIDLMTLGVEKGAEQPLQGYRLLVVSNMDRQPPNLDGALAASARVLDLTPEGNIEKLAQARIAHCELLIAKDLRQEALKELDLVGAKAPRNLRVQARLLQARCCEDDRQWDRAVSLWQDLLKESDLVAGRTARIWYQIGWCYNRMEPARVAEAAKAWTEALRLGGPEGQAAGLRLGEMRLSHAVNEPRQAIEDWKLAMRFVNSPDQFKNPYIKLEEARDLFEQALRQFQDHLDGQKAQEVAELYRKVAPGGVAEEKLAQTAESLALEMKRKGIASAAAVQQQFKLAGEAFEKAALARPELQRPEALWRSAQCYLSAREIQPGIDIFHRYVLIEKNAARLAEAWYTLGELYRLQGKKEKSHESFVKCLQYPSTPFAFKSRYCLAEEEIEKLNYDKAKSILEQNLFTTPDGAEIDRESQEKSQFKMGWVLFLMNNFSEARAHLADFIRLYPENSNVIRAQLRLGECYKRLADKEKEKEDSLSNEFYGAKPDDRKQSLIDQVSHHRKIRFEWLGESIKVYASLAERLESDAKTRSLKPTEQMLLRRARFGQGDSHLDAEEYSEALRVFLRLQQQHRQTLEAFFACTRICYIAAVPTRTPEQAKMTQQKAKESLEMLREDLKAMNPKHEVFQVQDASTRDEWQSWADKKQAQLNSPRPLDPSNPLLR